MSRWRAFYRPKRVDADQRDVVARLESIGASVEVIGQPLDLLVGYRGVNIIVEVKQPAGPRGGKSKDGQKLNEKQATFKETWKGAPPLVVTLSNCVAEVEAEADRRSR